MSATEFEADREADQQAQKMSVKQHPTEHYEKTKLTGTIPGHQQFHSIPKPGQLAYFEGNNSPDLRDALVGGDSPLNGNLPHDSFPGNSQNPFPDEPGVCGLRGIGREFSEPAFYDSEYENLQATLA